MLIWDDERIVDQNVVWGGLKTSVKTRIHSYLERYRKLLSSW